VSKKTDRFQPNLLPALLLIFGTWGAIVLLRMTAPSEIMDNDQERPAAYVLDVLRNGNWIVQRDSDFEITSKPPLVTWLTAGIAGITGELNTFTLYLPGALAVLATALVIFLASRPFGRWAGLLGALMYLCSMVALKQVRLARTDTVFALLVFVSFLVAYQATRRRYSWTWFWLVAALATLSKGPWGIVLTGGLIPALIWETRDRQDEDLSPPRLGPWRRHLPGLILFLVLTCGWFLAAWWIAGQPLIDKMIGRELVGHAIESDDGDGIASNLHAPSLYFLSRFAPWSILSVAGLVLVFTTAPGDTRQRYLGRALACFFLFGLLFFSLAPHQRADHLMPLMPAAAMLGGMALARWWTPADSRQMVLGFAPLAAAFLLALPVYYHVLNRNDGKIARSRWVGSFAEQIEETVGKDFPLIPVDMPFAVQFHLGTMRYDVAPETAAEALRSEAAAYVVVRNWESFEPLLPRRHHVVLQWPGADNPFLTVVSNRPNLLWYDQMVFIANGIRVETSNARIASRGTEFLRFNSTGQGPALRFTNISDRVREFDTQLDDGERRHVLLQPGESQVILGGSAPPTRITDLRAGDVQ
jgi:4-amino-4-deoxy-L-arabinose transferase-like glycosyltransferase